MEKETKILLALTAVAGLTALIIYVRKNKKEEEKSNIVTITPLTVILASAKGRHTDALGSAEAKSKSSFSGGGCRPVNNRVGMDNIAFQYTPLYGYDQCASAPCAYSNGWSKSW